MCVSILLTLSLPLQVDCPCPSDRMSVHPSAAPSLHVPFGDLQRDDRTDLRWPPVHQKIFDSGGPTSPLTVQGHVVPDAALFSGAAADGAEQPPLSAPPSGQAAWATAMNNLAIMPMGISGQQLVSGNFFSSINLISLPVIQR